MKPNKLFVTIKQFTDLYPWPSEYALRHIRQDGEENGFQEAFIKMGKRVLIDVDKFWECLEKKRKKN